MENAKYHDMHRLVFALNPAVFAHNRWAGEESGTPITKESIPDFDSMKSWYKPGHQLYEAIDLLSQCLNLDLTKRIQAQDALNHPFLQGYVRMGESYDYRPRVRPPHDCYLRRAPEEDEEDEEEYDEEDDEDDANCLDEDMMEDGDGNDDDVMEEGGDDGKGDDDDGDDNASSSSLVIER